MRGFGLSSPVGGFAGFLYPNGAGLRKEHDPPLHIKPCPGSTWTCVKEVERMTMTKRESNSIWSLVREDRDVDDLIFGQNSREMAQPCSDR